MQRFLMKDLQQWKGRSDRTPLLVQGARQVGKTHILHVFGKDAFPKYHYFNFEETPEIHAFFEQRLDPLWLLQQLSYFQEEPINPDTDLVIFDEIQECPEALTSLKYFCEKLPQLSLVGAGSLLGVHLAPKSFPVGKVEFLDLYPMSFREFLYAQENELMIQAFEDVWALKPIPDIAHQRLWEKLKAYLITGGMPKAVQAYKEHASSPEAFFEVRRVQKNILKSYLGDFAKHSGKINSMHITSVFENVPLQLSATLDGSTQRYRFKDVIPKKKGFSALEGPIQWLLKARLLLKVSLCNKAQLPLNAFCQPNLFKLFFWDVGMLGCVLDLSPFDMMNHDYGITKGFIAENFVAQELMAHGKETLFAWKERNAEIEFLTAAQGNIYPIEVKAGHRTQAKSLSQFEKTYAPSQSYLLSAHNYHVSGSRVYVPLYLAGKLSTVS